MRNGLKKLLVFAFIASIPAWGAQSAFAAGNPGPNRGGQADNDCGCNKGMHDRHGGKEHFQKLARQLGLSDQQKAQVQDIFKASRERNRPLFTSLMTEKRQLRNLIHNGSDDAAIRAQSAKVAALEADLAVARASMARQFKGVLTPDQREKLKALMQEKEKKMEERLRSHDHEWMGEHGPME